MNGDAEGELKKPHVCGLRALNLTLSQMAHGLAVGAEEGKLLLERQPAGLLLSRLSESPLCMR